MASFWQWRSTILLPFPPPSSSYKSLLSTAHLLSWMKGRALWCKPAGIVAMTWHSIYKQPMSIHISAWVGRLQTTHQHQCLLFMIFMVFGSVYPLSATTPSDKLLFFPSLKLTFRTGSHGLLQVGIFDRFPFGKQPIFRWLFAASFREAKPKTLCGPKSPKKKTTGFSPAVFFRTILELCK